MKAALTARLVNPPFGDPGLHINLHWQGTAIQFDLGRLDRFPAAELLKLTHVFVSHTHIDHFIGFDRVMRLFLSRDATVAIYGPPGIIANVCGKLAGYTWNLVDGYPLVFEVHEVSPTSIHSVRLPATSAFAVEEMGERPFTGILCELPGGFSVHAVHLDHKIFCLGLALQEATHFNVRRDELDRLGLEPGPWLSRLKDAIRLGLPATTPIPVAARADEQAVRTMELGELQDRLVLTTPGQRFAYVVDTLFSAANAAKIAELARHADVFFCESPFLDEDRHQAVHRYHLTARQAGTLARMAGAKRLEVFHFSPRYDGQAERLYNEAAATFAGEIAADQPV